MARGAEPLTFETLRTLHDEALKAGEIQVERPRRLLLLDDDKTREQIYTGGVRIQDAGGFPEYDALVEYARVRNLRALKPAEGENPRERDKVYDQAEALIGQLVAPKREFGTAGKLRSTAWKLLFRYEAAAARRRGNEFDGFVPYSVPKGWDERASEGLTPFDPKFRDYHGSGGIRLIGRAGHVLDYMTAFNYRVYQVRKIDPKDWQWRTSVDLNPDNPPVAFFQPGSRYYFRVRTGDHKGEPFPRLIDDGVVEIRIPALN